MSQYKAELELRVVVFYVFVFYNYIISSLKQTLSSTLYTPESYSGSHPLFIMC